MKATGLLAPAELWELSGAKAACIDVLRYSLPSTWPQHIAQLVTEVSAYRRRRDGHGIVHLVISDVSCELARLVGPTLDPVALTRALSDAVDGDTHPGLRQRVVAVVRAHIGRVSMRELVSGSHARRTTEYIDTHLNTKLTAATLARVSGWPQHELARHFKAHVGMPIHEYVVRARIRRAIELLLQRQKVLAAMAEVGYRNKTSFNRAFKRLTGLTPKAFRRERAGAFRDSIKPTIG